MVGGGSKSRVSRVQNKEEASRNENKIESADQKFSLASWMKQKRDSWESRISIVKERSLEIWSQKNMRDAG